MPTVTCPHCENEVYIEGEDFPSDASETTLAACPLCELEMELSWYAVFVASIPAASVSGQEIER